MARRWALALASSVVASGLALAFMLWARAALQIRTLPERIMESVLLLVPPDQFEGAIEKYGPAAKEYALYATTAVMFLALVGIGIAAIRFVRSPVGLVLVGLGLWLLAMVAIMPLTGAGIFATGLFQNPGLINAVYLGIGLAYGTILLLPRLVGESAVPAIIPDGPPMFRLPARRAFLAGTAGTAASFAVTLALGKTSNQIASSLPLASLAPADVPGPAPEGGSSAQGASTAPANASSASSSVTSGIASSSSGAAGSGSQSAASGQNGTAQPSGVAATSASPSSQTSVSQPFATAKPSASTQSASPAGASSSAPAISPPATVDYPSPPPERPLPRDKDGALLAVNKPRGQLQDLVTPNDDWYTVTKNAGGDPRIEARDWRLIVDGSVNRPVQLDYATLVRLPQVNVYKTLECISNLTAKCELTSFGCDLISTAKWTGAKLSDVINLAGGLKPGVVAIAAIGADEFSSSLPASAASDPDVLLVYRMNDQPLPREHGFPVRAIIPDRYGMKNAKWVINIKPMTQAYVDWYGQRNWSQQGIVNTMARVDVPAPGAQLQPGANQIAGIAYGGNRGINKVEFSTDGGNSWQPTVLVEQPVGKDVFVRWQGSFQIAAGQNLSLTVRATDGSGRLQTGTFNLPQPNGGTGWDTISISA